MDEVEHDDSPRTRPSALPSIPCQKPIDWSVYEQDARKVLGIPDIISPSLSCNSRLGSAFDKLPREVVSEIFLIVVGDLYSQAIANSPLPGTKQALTATKIEIPKLEETPLLPLRLSHVSRHWRFMAVTTPRLWTYLHVVVRQAYITSALELIKLWVPRAKACPLWIDVSFEALQGPIVVYPEDWLTLFRAMAKAAMLLRDTTVRHVLDQQHLETHVRASSRGTTPVVEERYLWLYGIDKMPTSREAVPLIVQSSRKAVSEFGFEYHRPLRSSLTRLVLQDTNGLTTLSNLELQIILSEFPLLEHVCAHLETGHMVLDDQVEVRNLKRLQLSWAFMADPGPLLDKVDSPMLEELELAGDLSTGVPWMHLWHFIVRNRPPLLSLALEHFDARAPVSRLADTLSLCEHLKKLWLTDCVLDNSVLTTLGRRANLLEGAVGDSILSRLDGLGITSCPDVDGGLLVDVLAHALPTRLRDLTIVDCAQVSLEDCIAIDELFKGMKMKSYTVTPGDPFD